MLGWLGWMGLQIPLALCGPPQAAALTGRATPLQTFALVKIHNHKATRGHTDPACLCVRPAAAAAAAPQPNVFLCMKPRRSPARVLPRNMNPPPSISRRSRPCAYRRRLHRERRRACSIGAPSCERARAFLAVAAVASC